MINTGRVAENNISMSKTANGKINVIENINSKNEDTLNLIIDNSDLYIDAKFPLPVSSSMVISKKSKTISSLNSKLSDLLYAIGQGTSTEIVNETQFNTFKAKVNFWVLGFFSNIIDIMDDNRVAKIVIHRKMSKHERRFIEWLSELGADVTIISENINIKRNNKISNTVNNGVIIGNYDESLAKEKAYEEDIETVRYETLDDIESALYKDKNTVKVIVSGINNYIDTCNFYGKLYETCENNSGFVLVKNGFDKPTPEETGSTPRLSNTKHDYLVITLSNFINIKNEKHNNEVVEALVNYFNSGENKELSGQILYNKIVYTICCINKLYNNGKPTCIVHYGKANKNDINIFQVLSKIRGLSLIVVSSDKKCTPNIDGVYKLEMSDSIEIFEMPIIDKRSGASTLAVQVQKQVNDTLFSDNTLGLYKPGQFSKCDVIDFNTTYDEIELWWNTEMYLRPGFLAEGNNVVLPTMFKIIKGSKWNNNRYREEVKKYCYGKTLLCRNAVELEFLTKQSKSKIYHMTDINGTAFTEQKPFFKNGKLDRNRIMRGINYSYGFLDVNKQNLILDKTEDLLNNNKIDKKSFASEEEYVDRILNVCLNLHDNILKLIHWFEFYTCNPNLILFLGDRDTPNIDGVILLAFLNSIGFDILVFVPTRFETIERMCGPELRYNTDIIGDVIFDVGINYMNVREDKENPIIKKPTLFSKLFNKK